MDDFKVRDLSRIFDSRNYYFSLLQDRQDILNFILTGLKSEDFDDASNWIRTIMKTS